MLHVLLLTLVFLPKLGSTVSVQNQTILTCNSPALSLSIHVNLLHHQDKSNNTLGTPQRRSAWSTPLGVFNQGPNPVQIQLCTADDCLSDVNKLTCVPQLPPFFNGTLTSPLVVFNNLSFGAIRLVYCSTLNGHCFDGNDPRYRNIVTTSTSNNYDNAAYAATDTSWSALHIVIPPVIDNAALCWDDDDCQKNESQPICSRDSAKQPRCVTVQHFLGTCGTPCLLKSTGYRCWCHRINDLFSYTYGAIGITLVLYFLIYFRITRARALALKRNAWGMRNALLPIYRTCYQFFGIYLIATIALRIVLSLDDNHQRHRSLEKGGILSSSHSHSSNSSNVYTNGSAYGSTTTTVLGNLNGPLHVVQWYEEGQLINVGLRSFVAFLEETLLESVVFFFVQYGSGMDQGYRAVAGGITCGIIYAALTALQHLPIGTSTMFPDLTATGTCIGCLLDREGFGYHRPYSSYCYVQLLRSGVYECSSIVLYLFVLCQRRYENMILDNGGSLFRCCCHCLMREPSLLEKKKVQDRKRRRSNNVSFVGSDSSAKSLVQPLLQAGGGGSVQSIQSGSVRSMRSFHSEKSRTSSTATTTTPVLLLQRNVHFDRFLILLIVLRLLDMSYMLSSVGSCTVLVGSFMWLLWLQIELYILFLSDTQYWKNYMNDLVKRSQNEMTERNSRRNVVGGSNNNGEVEHGGAVLHGIVFSDSIENSNGTTIDENIYKNNFSSHLLLSPAASHWVQPRNNNTSVKYHHPPLNKMNESCTDDHMFYSRGRKKRESYSSQRRQKRRGLGGGKTITEDFNEEAAVSALVALLFLLGNVNSLTFMDFLLIFLQAKRFQRLIEPDVISTSRSYSVSSLNSINRISLDFGPLEDDLNSRTGHRSKSIAQPIITNNKSNKSNNNNNSSSSNNNSNNSNSKTALSLRGQLSSVSVGGIFSTSPTNSMYWDPVYDHPSEDPFRVGSYGKMTSMMEQKADILVNGGVRGGRNSGRNSGRTSPTRSTPTAAKPVPFLSSSAFEKGINHASLGTSISETKTNGRNGNKSSLIATTSTSTRPPRSSTPQQHPQVTIPSVESITIDFSAVRVYKHKEIDVGSTATVYKGKYMNEQVAVKLCRLRTLNQKSVADFVRESRTLATFNHTNVMRLVGCCPVPPHFMIVAEYCSRGNLAKVLHGKEQQTILTWHMRLFLALGAARGVNHVHSKGFMHGDIKPDNFIVTEDWTVKISDFGKQAKPESQV